MTELNPILEDYDEFLWFHPNFDMEQFKHPNLPFVLSIDLAEGGGGDYNVCNILQLLPMSATEIDGMKIYSSEYSFFKLVQVGIFRCNTISVGDFAQYVYHLLVDIMTMENVKVIVEMNYEGSYFRNIITTLYGDENMIDEDYTFIRFAYNQKDEESTATRFGLRQTEETKDHGCKISKDLIKYNKIIISDCVTINEALSFAKNPKKKGKGSYESMTGHDDAIMTVINVSHIFDMEDFQELCDILLESKLLSKEFTTFVNKKLNRNASLENDDRNGGDISDLF